MRIAPDELELMSAITASIVRQLGAAACSICLLDGVELVFVAASGVGADEVLGVRIPVGQGIAGWVAASGQGIAVADVSRDRRFDSETAERTGYVPATILAVPVEGDDGPLGVLEVLDRVSGASDLEVAADAARQVALARQLAEARTALDAELSDPGLADLLGMVARLARRSPADHRLATRLLTAVLDDPA